MGDEEDDHVNFVINVPFTCVTSVGGAFDDRAFVAGYQIGAIDAQLAQPNSPGITALVYEELEHQCDLIAMHHGFVSRVVRHEDIWIQVEFRKGSRAVGDDEYVLGA